MKKPENKRGRLEIGGFLLGLLGGLMAILESTIVVAYTTMRGEFGRYGLVGLGVAVLILVGCTTYWRFSKPFGAILMFLSALVGQLIGGIFGLILATSTYPASWAGAIYGFDFLVSGWTVFSLIGSILILVGLWRGRRRTKL